MVTQLEIKKQAKKKEKVYKSFQDIPVHEQRYFPRWEVSNRAYYCLGNKDHIVKTETKDISPTGASLHISPDVGLNERVDVKIYLSDDKSFQATGKVIWKCLVNDQDCFAGVVFDPLPEETQNTIAAYAFPPVKF